MSLLSFRAPVLYAACHHCGNALTHGEPECPHCGTNQSRALRTVGAPNSVDYGNNVVLMPGRMLVPYPSVPDELDTAMNIARERKRVLKRVAFYLASAGMLAMAQGLAYAPALRSPVVQRLAALP
ncbi:zinc ribbon domain-containing protein, partial [Caballeronia sp. M23-90]